jgi:hypothetical protein
MQQYKHIFDMMMGVKDLPNTREELLLKRAQHYIVKLSKIPWVKMIAIVNSLSMYATHDDSDIDLLIVTQPGMIWFVRFFATFILWSHGVWRHGEDVAGNFCLSFFVTTNALDLRAIAIENDIYLYYWIYYLKPVFDREDTYEKFVRANEWVDIRVQSAKYKVQSETLDLRDVPSWTQDWWSWDTTDVQIAKYKVQSEASKISPFSFLLSPFSSSLNSLIRFLWLPKTLRKYRKLWSPEGVIISDDILKFHDRDRRREIRDTILEKYFDK